MDVEKNIIYGGNYEKNLESSLGEITYMVLKLHEDRVLQIDAETGEELSASLLLNRSVAVAKWFQTHNLGVGDSISICSDNRLEFITVPVAGIFLGITFAPLNPEYTTGELKHVLNLSKPKIIFVAPQFIDKILSVLEDHPYIIQVVLFGKKKKTHKLVTMFDDIVKGVTATNGDETFEPPAVNPETTIATILCSSGTTGLPKGVMTTHANMTSYIDISRHMLSEYMEDDISSDTLIGVVPFFHSMGFMLMYLSAAGGRRMIVMKKFTPKVFLEGIVKYKVTRLIVPPPIILFLTKHPMVKKYDLSCLTDIRSGAAPMGHETERIAKNKFNVMHVSQSYGMTETTLGVLLSPRNKPRFGSVGLLVPGMWCKVIDEDGKPLGANKEGELCFKGPLIMKGYIGDSASTAIAIDKDGWLHTGDVGYYDNDGYFYIVDRIKELIKYQGFQVAPAELEALLLTHPAVADAAVVGLPDERVGELPLGFVVKKIGKEVTAKELEAYIAEKVSPQKRLRGGVYFLDHILRNPTGKILRRVLRETAKQFKSKL